MSRMNKGGIMITSGNKHESVFYFLFIGEKSFFQSSLTIWWMRKSSDKKEEEEDEKEKKGKKRKINLLSPYYGLEVILSTFHTNLFKYLSLQ